MVALLFKIVAISTVKTNYEYSSIIILIASIMLGLCLFSLIAGEQETSIYSAVKGVWNTEIQARTLEDGL